MSVKGVIRHRKTHRWEQPETDNRSTTTRESVQICYGVHGMFNSVFEGRAEWKPEISPCASHSKSGICSRQTWWSWEGSLCSCRIPVYRTLQASKPHTWADKLQRCINTLRPSQNGRRVADDTFERIFVNENVRISIQISLKFVPKGPINNIPGLVQIMAWRRPGDKPLSEPMMVRLPTHICVTRPQWVNISTCCVPNFYNP